MSKVDDFFVEAGIDYDEVEAQVARLVHTNFMYKKFDISYRQITIPDNSEYNYFLFIPQVNDMIHGVMNMIESRIYTKAEVTYETSSDYTDLSAYEPEDEESVCAGFHGNGIMFKTEDEPQEIVLRITHTSKSQSNFHADFKESFKLAYYHMVNKNIDQLYHYIRDLSNEKNNIVSERKFKSSKSERRYGRLRGYQL